MNYTQLSSAEREVIATLRKKRFSCRKIAECLGRHHSTVCREIDRNKRAYDGGYRVSFAIYRASARRWKTRKKSQFSDRQWQYVKQFLAFEWSPEQISQTLRKHNKMDISHETIYRYIRNDFRKGGELYSYLRQANKARRKRHNSSDSRGILRGKRPIEERPEEAETRSVSGHFEIDLMHGPNDTDCILTLVDRKTRFLIIRKMRSKSMLEVKKHLVRLIRKYKIKTLTADNGTEWHAFKEVESLTNASFYFAKPYHSWERGTNENTNGLIRQYIPKGVSMKKVDQHYCNRLMKRINRRPRKVLNWQCPESCYLGFDFVALLS